MVKIKGKKDFTRKGVSRKDAKERRRKGISRRGAEHAVLRIDRSLLTWYLVISIDHPAFSASPRETFNPAASFSLCPFCVLCASARNLILYVLFSLLHPSFFSYPTVSPVLQRYVYRPGKFLPCTIPVRNLLQSDSLSGHCRWF